MRPSTMLAFGSPRTHLSSPRHHKWRQTSPSSSALPLFSLTAMGAQCLKPPRRRITRTWTKIPSSSVHHAASWTSRRFVGFDHCCRKTDATVSQLVLTISKRRLRTTVGLAVSSLFAEQLWHLLNGSLRCLTVD